jgi:sugar phosphate isomerase/epimerase
MKLVVSGTGDYYEGQPISRLLDVAQRYEADCLELWYPKNTRVLGLDESLRLLGETGLQVVAVSTWTHLCTPGDVSAEQALLFQGIELAARLGGRYASTYFGHGEVRDDELLMGRYIEHLRPCLQRAEELGVTICLENEFNVLGDDPLASDITRRPWSIRELVERIDSPHFRLTYDACNFYFAGVEPFPYAYELLKDYIVYVHLKDGARYDPHLYDQGMLRFSDQSGEYVCLPVGQGAINYTGILSQLAADGYDGFMTLEPHVEPARMEATYQQTLDTLRASEGLIQAESGRRQQS